MFTLLVFMRCSVELVHLQCINYFLANVNTRSDDSIHSVMTSTMYQGIEDVNNLTNSNSFVVQALLEPWLDLASLAPSNISLYLTIERPLHYNMPNICLAGRIDETIVDIVDLLDVLVDLLNNIDEPRVCFGHASSKDIINIRASK